MGEVYRARDTKLDRDVAIKVLPAAVAGDPERIARFEREAKVLASLNHPNIAAIYGLEESATGSKAIVLELVEGPTLEDRVEAGPLELTVALRIALAIAEALESAHEKGIAHRDLKPANVKAPLEGTVKVLDLGLATALPGSGRASGEPANSLTVTMAASEAGMILGTAAYMSPEQASGKRVDKRADIWSFGVVLWEMLTGKGLFDGGETLSHTLADVLRADIDFGKLPATTPAPIRDLLKRCLDRDVKTRLRDIGEARVVISRYLANPNVPAEAPPRTEGRTLRKPFLAMTAAAAAAALFAAWMSYIHFREPAPPLVKLQLSPPERGTFVQSRGPLAVSPDGRHVAFEAIVEGKSNLWLRDLDSLSARMLPGTQNGRNPFWSPDSRNLGFFSSGLLMRIGVSGGPALTICNAENPLGGTWNQNDVIVFGSTQAGILFRVPAAGGTPAPVTELDPALYEQSHRLPWFLPDGRHFLYQAMPSPQGKITIFVGDLESKEKKTVVRVRSNAVYVHPGYLLFLRDRTLMAQSFDTGKLVTKGDAFPIAEQVDLNGNTNMSGYFSASQNGVLAYASGGLGVDLQITWYDRSGKVLGTVGTPADIQTPRLSPDGRTIAVDRASGPLGSDIWLLDVARGTEQRLTFDSYNIFPVWSPDGSRVAYSKISEGRLILKAANGTGQEEILESSLRLPMDWTRDGALLFLATGNPNPKTGNDIWAMPMSGPDAHKPFPVRQTEFSEWHPRASPDGRWLAYESDETKRKEIYVTAFPAFNGQSQISVNGGRYPVWSRDGRELYFVGLDNQLMAVDVRQNAKSGAQFQAGLPKPLFYVRIGNLSPTFDVSADGRFLIATPVRQSAVVPITVVLNWPAWLTK